MLTTVVDRIRNDTEVGVPRKFSIGTLFVLLTIYGVLFRLLVVLGTDVAWTSVICLFFAAVTVGQMVLFHGERPRTASIVSGAVTCPTILVAVAIDEMLTQFTGWAPMSAGLLRPFPFVAAMLLMMIGGMGLGYFVGGAIASVFYVFDRLRPNSGIAGLRKAPVTGRGPSPASGTTLLISTVGRWINPVQPNAPLRGALAAFLVPTILGCLISPFITWAMPHQVILVAAGVGLLLSVWSGNFQLWLFWPMILCPIGALVVAWPTAALLEIPMFEDMFRESPEWLRLVLRVLGILVGLTISALAGWTQWFWRGRDRDRRLGVVSFGGFALLLVSIFLLAAYGLEAWAQSSRQQFFRTIRAGGGSLGWSDLGGRTLNSVYLPESFGDDDFLRLRPLLVNPWAVQLTGKRFTDESVRALEGLHVTGLTLTETSISDAGFDGLSDVSASWLDLRFNQIGEGALAALTAIPVMRKNLAGLTLDRTEITDDGLRYLARCRGLTYLSLGHCAISDEGLKTLMASAPQLQQLNLVGTEISDEGLAHLTNAPNLRDVRVNGTGVTQLGVDRLTDQLPRCTVSWDEPTEP